MNIWFRTDASFVIGTGHVMRCLTLADALRDCGCISHFVCRAHEGNLADLIRLRGHVVHLLITDCKSGGEVGTGANFPAYAAWLGCDWLADAMQTMTEMGDVAADWLIVDHYALDARWEQHLRAKSRKIMVIDDLADRPHDCDLLLDQNLIAGWEQRYRGRVPSACGLMLGPRYALLQPSYAELHARVPFREGPIHRILIYFGGADNDNLTGMALSAVLSLQCTNLAVDVVINPAGVHADAVRRQAQSSPSVTLHTTLPSLAPLMVKADIAIGASGATSWERCCLGLPTLVVTLAENQRPIAAELDRLGMIRWLGDKDQVKEADLIQALAAILRDGLAPSWSERCSRAVDGHGTERVRAVLLLDSGRPLRARPAIVEDAVLIQQWGSVGNEEIDDEIARFRQGLRDLDDCRIYVIEADDNFAIGLVRVERSGNTWDISHMLAPLAQGRKLEMPGLEAAICMFRKSVGDTLLFGRTNDLRDMRWRDSAVPVREPGTSKNLLIAICSDTGSWVNDSIPILVLEWLAAGHSVAWTHSAAELPDGDICFYLSYGRIVDAATRSRYRHNLVVHASDLPKGRGWSPATWLILEGANRIPVSLLEAVDQVDAGEIYLQEWIELDGTELVEEWRGQLAQKTVDLVRAFVNRYPDVLEAAREQVGEPSTYPRRRANDSALESEKTIAEQMNLLRVVDNESYPAFFSYGGREFVLKISRRKAP